MPTRSHISLVLFLITVAATAQFSPPKNIGHAMLSSPESLVECDFDADGDIDILVGGRGIVLLLNMDGSGDFKTIQVLDVLSTVSAQTLHMVDVDSDGNNDVVLEGDDVLWMRNLGDEQFAPPAPFPNTVTAQYGIRFDDFDGDGDQDAFIVQGGLILRMENLGNGQFGPAQTIGDAYAIYSLMLHDYDGDGDRDIAVIYETPGNAAWLKLFLHENDGTYVVQADFSVSCGVTSGDFGRTRSWDQDGDGMHDLIFADCLGYGPVTWRRNLGAGVFAQAVPLTTFSEAPFSLGPLDLDGDGVSDLIGLTETGLETARGLGNNTYEPAVVAVPYWTDPYRHLAADVDGDGTAELFIILPNRGYLEQFRLPGDGSLQLHKVLIGHSPRINDHMRVADLNGDGAPEMLCTSRARGFVVAYSNTGSEGFTGPHLVISSDRGINGIELADMNADGMLDILFYDDSLHIHLNQGNLSFPRTTSFRPGTAVNADEFKCTDLDGDGHQDLMFTGADGLHRFRNNGDDTFSELGNTPALAWPSRPDLHGFMDVDEDGDLDVLATSSPGGLQWVRNDGGMAFGERIAFSGVSNAEYVEAVDMDGDSHQDIFIVQNTTNTLARAFWLQGLGSGSFSLPMQLVAVNAHGNCSARPLNVDKDGDMDVVIAVEEGGFWVENLGEAGFAPEQSISTVAWNAPTVAQECVLDMDADGDQDLVFIAWQEGSESLSEVRWVENFGVDPYKLSGTVFADLDGNGSRGPDEPELPGVTLVADLDGYVEQSAEAGAYTIHCNTGAHVVSAVSPGPFWELSTVPASYSVEATDAEPVITGLDFGFAPTQDVGLLLPEIVLSGAPCSSLTSLWTSVINDGTRSEQGLLSLTLDPAFTFWDSQPEPVSVVGNVITWDLDTLMLAELAVFHARVVMPAAALSGTPYVHTAEVITQDDQGVVTGSYTTSDNGVLACAYDPNDKQVSPVGYGTPGAVGVDQDHLVYTVRFQNTGTATALDVMVRDQLSGSLDRTHMDLLGASHEPTSISISPSGELVVRFDGIQLPDSGSELSGSQGFIRFRIGLLPGQPHLTEVRNTAEIYFDLNEEVVTNTVLNTLVDCNLWLPEAVLLGDGVLEATEGDVYQWYLDGDTIDGATEPILMFTVAGTYAVSVLSRYGCLAISPPFVAMGVAMDPPTRLRLSVVPNPFTSDARLFLTEAVTLSDRIEVIDATGRLVRSIAAQGAAITIQRAGLSSGLYLVRIVRKGEVIGAVRMLVD